MSVLDNLTPSGKEVVKKALTSTQVQLLMGREEWGLTEDEEMELWKIINALENE